MTSRKPPTHLTVAEIENIKVLKASGLTNYSVSKRVGRSVKTVKRCCQEPRNAEEIRSLQQEIASFFEDLTMRLLTSISDADIEKMNGQSRFVSAGIAVDKLRLLRGDSTENIAVKASRAAVFEMDQQIIELEKKLSN